MTGLDVLTSELMFEDEWILGSGGAFAWTPPAPVALDQPGFRDAGDYLGCGIAPVFAVTLVDEAIRSVPLHACRRSWNPARLELTYQRPEILLTEHRLVPATDTCVSRLTLAHAGSASRRFWVVLWARRPDGLEGRKLVDLEANAQGICFQESDLVRKRRWGCALGASFDADSWSVDYAASAGPAVRWSATPFADLMTPGGLPGHTQPADDVPGYAFLALAYPFELPPGERLSLTLAAAFGADVEAARGRLARTVSLVDPVQACEEDWINWFEEVPAFTCSRRDWQRQYWYRWAERRIYRAWPLGDEEGDLLSGAVTVREPYAPSGTGGADDTGALGQGSTRAATLAAERRGGREPRDAAVATGASARAADVRPAERVAAAIEGSWRHASEQVHRELRELLRETETPWLDQPVAGMLRRVLALHPDPSARRRYRRLLDNLLQEQDGEPSQSLTATAVPPWNQRALPAAPLPSLRRCVMAGDAARLLDWLDALGGKDSPVEQPTTSVRSAARLRAVRDFWDADLRWFAQTVPLPGGGARPAATACGLTPLLIDRFVGPQERAALLEGLADPGRFWTSCPVPTLSREDRDFDADGTWEGRRLDDPEHGRSRPEITSLVLDALSTRIEEAGPLQRHLACQLLERYLATARSTPAGRPTWGEHYHPLTGRPAGHTARGGSGAGWPIDHLLRLVAGIRPREDGVVLIDPLPMQLDWFVVKRCFVGDHELEVQWDHRAGLSVRLDDELIAHAPVGRAVVFPLPSHWRG